jgi:4-hydroxyphenylpyruvate dioxygenase
MPRSFFRPAVALAAVDNPLGIAGLEFVEFAAHDPAELGRCFEQLGFKATARHLSKNVTLYRQGRANFLVNAEPDSFAARYAQEYGMGICAIGVRVDDAKRAFKHALADGAWPFQGEPVEQAELHIPAIQGIGDSHIYFVDRWRDEEGRHGRGGDGSIFDIDFRPLETPAARPGPVPAGAGLSHVDHMTQMVGPGRLQEWLDFYRDLFRFREIHEIDPGWRVAADARVMISPCGELVIPLYEEGVARTELMHAYLPDHPGEGVQHIALATDDILACVDTLRGNGVTFIEPPARYYDTLDANLAGHGLDIAALRARGILVDGELGADGQLRLFFQTFVEREPGRIFFEIVQRNGYHGFGEGNLETLARARRMPA